MTNDEYRVRMDLLVNQVRILKHIDFDTMLETVERAESVGFLFVEPMEYSNGIENLRDAKRVLRAAKALVDIAEEIAQRGRTT